MISAVFFSLSMVSDSTYAAEVSLAWDANTEQNLAGYKLYYQTGSGGDSYNGTGANEGNSPITIFLNNLIDPNSPAYLLTGLGDGREYSFSVTAFTGNGTESDFSNQISITTKRVTTAIPDYPLPAVSTGDEPLLFPAEISIEGFSDPDTGDYHSKTQWQVYRTTDMVCVLDTITSSYLTVFRIPEIILDENTTYFWRARFFDNRGAASEWSENIGFKTGFSDTDTDGDGVPDDQEVNISVDMNRDNMPDAQQAVIKSIMLPSCNEPIGLSIENANTVKAILSMSAVDTDDFDFKPADEEKIKDLPYQLIIFKLAVDRPGDTAVVTVHFSRPASSSAKWIKFDPIQGVWLDCSAYAVLSDDGMSVTLELVDGGFGDVDGVANGIIVDPSGLDQLHKTESSSMGIADNPSGFNHATFLAVNADLPQTWNKADCMNHYKLFGFWEKRAIAFNVDEYLNANPDLPINWTYEEAFNHYTVFGKNEDRLLAFEAVEYLSLYPDLPQDWSYDEAFAHYLNFGKNEGRIASFDETAYLEMYPDLPHSWGQAEAFNHYLHFGKYENRVYDPYDEAVFLTD